MILDRTMRKAAVSKDKSTLWSGSRVYYRWMWRLLGTAATIAWMGVIFQLSSSSPADLPHQIGWFSWLGEMRDVVAHLALYGVLGSLLVSSIWSWVAGSAHQHRWVVLAVGLGVLYGLSDEAHQSFVPGRAASLFDVGVDGVGLIVSVVALRYVMAGLLRGLRDHETD